MVNFTFKDRIFMIEALTCMIFKIDRIIDDLSLLHTRKASDLKKNYEKQRVDLLELKTKICYLGGNYETPVDLEEGPDTALEFYTCEEIERGVDNG